MKVWVIVDKKGKPVKDGYYSFNVYCKKMAAQYELQNFYDDKIYSIKRMELK